MVIMKAPQGPRKVRLKVAPKLERIYRVLLDDPLRKWSIKGLTKEALTEYHWTYDVFKELEAKGYVFEGKIIDVVSMFELWSKRPSHSSSREYHVQDPESLLLGQKKDFAVTTYFAENKLGQYLLPKRMDIYLHKTDLNFWHEEVIKVGYVGKGNLRLLISDEHVFWHSKIIEGLRIVGTQQLIVDLLREGGVCTEAAENLIRRYYGQERVV
jgi:hypothetical protein